MPKVESPFRPVEPARPVAGYIGGKRNLARRLVELIEAAPHTLYAEPFVGMGGVFLRRRLAPPAEVINDISGDVACLFRILQRHYVAFLDMLRYGLTSRREFERLMKVDPATLTDLERAARFLYLQRTAFGSKVEGRNFGVSPQNPARFDLTKLVPMLEAVHERLSGVVIECLPYAEFIARYDRPGALFYVDPPYWGSEEDYGEGLFGRDDFARLAGLLAGIEGRFILSINDVKPVREAFKTFSIQAVSTSYSLPHNSRPRGARELIVTGPVGKNRGPR